MSITKMIKQFDKIRRNLDKKRWGEETNFSSPFPSHALIQLLPEGEGDIRKGFISGERGKLM